MRPHTMILAAFCTFSTLNSSNAAVSDKHLQWWVNQRVVNLTARFANRPFDEIGWADDLQHAYRLARQHGRPLFVFTFDGIGLDTGRC